MQTIKCNSCGASGQNIQNCEFCGSLFVRYNNLGLSLTNVLSDKGELTGFVFPGLENELKKNLSMQTDTNFIVTDIEFLNINYAQIVASNMVIDLLQTSNITVPSISIHLPFTEDREAEHYKFSCLKEKTLFKHSYNNEFSCHDYIMEFGKDALGAAYLVSKLLIEVEGLNRSTSLIYKTSDYS